MAYTAEARIKARAAFEENRSPEERAEFFRNLSAAGAAGRRARRAQREQALTDLRRSLEILLGESFGDTA